MRKTFLILFFVLPFFVLNAADSDVRGQEDVSKNFSEGRPNCTFLFIGEGVSSELLELAGMYYESTGRKLNFFNAFTVKGSVTCTDESSFRYDPASTATAIACGKKTASGYVAAVPGEVPDKVTLTSVCFKAKNRGCKTGVITDAAINGDVAASFFSSSSSTKKYGWTAIQMSYSAFDYFGSNGMLGDGIERAVVLEVMLRDGYTFLDGNKELSSYMGKSKLLVKSAERDVFQIQNDENAIPLSAHVGKAVSVFSGAQGFFIVVDADKIDCYCTGNDAASAVAAIGELDEAIGCAVNFMNEKNHAKTLVVFASTGNAGGLKFTKNGLLSKSQLSILSAQKSTAKEIASKTQAFVDAYPENSDGSETLFDGTASFAAEQYGITLSDAEKSQLRRSWNGDKKSFNAVLFTDEVRSFRDKLVGITWTGKSHYPFSVPVMASGVGSAEFKGKTTFEEFGRKISFAVAPEDEKDAE